MIRLSEVESILEAQPPGLMPFTPLMKAPSDMSAVDWTTRCAAVTQALPVDSAMRNNLMVELWVMSGLAHERQNLLNINPGGYRERIIGLPNDYVNKVLNKVFEQGIEQGIEQGKQLGARQSTIAHILNLLNRRFNVSMAPTLTPSLEAD